MKKLLLTALILSVAVTASAGTMLFRHTPKAGSLIEDDASWTDTKYNGVPILFNERIAQNINYIKQIDIFKEVVDGQVGWMIVKIISKGQGTVQYNTVKGQANFHKGFTDNDFIPQIAFEDSGLIYDAGEVTRVIEKGIIVSHVNRSLSKGDDWSVEYQFDFETEDELDEFVADLTGWALQKGFSRRPDLIDVTHSNRETITQRYVK